MGRKLEQRNTIKPEDAAFLRLKLSHWGTISELSEKTGVAKSTLYKFISTEYAYRPKAETLVKILMALVPREELPDALRRFQGYFGVEIEAWVKTFDSEGKSISEIEDSKHQKKLIDHFRWLLEEYRMTFYDSGDMLFSTLTGTIGISEANFPDLIIHPDDAPIALVIASSENAIRSIAKYYALLKIELFTKVLFYVPNGFDRQKLQGHDDICSDLPSLVSELLKKSGAGGKDPTIKPLRRGTRRVKF